jgi:hypothetical protein
MMNLDNYMNLIESFKNNGYQFRGFDDEIRKKGDLLLRHDVDFDVELALKLAQLESRIEVLSTYFFLVRSDSYNILSPQNFESIQRIKDLGHHISLHFDPLIYEDYVKGLEEELEIFSRLFSFKPKVISIHRPNEDFLNGVSLGVSHTYQKKFFSEIKYISDSGGKFKFGHPLESDAFASRESIHLLLHPIWWVTDQVGNIAKLKAHYQLRCRALSDHFARNCIPWKDHLEGKL